MKPFVDLCKFYSLPCLSVTAYHKMYPVISEVYILTSMCLSIIIITQYNIQHVGYKLSIAQYHNYGDQKAPFIICSPPITGCDVSFVMPGLELAFYSPRPPGEVSGCPGHRQMQRCGDAPHSHRRIGHRTAPATIFSESSLQLQIIIDFFLQQYHDSML